MKKTLQKTMCITLVILAVILIMTGCQKTTVKGSKETTSATNVVPEDSAATVLTVAIKEINKHGNVILDTTFDEMKSHGMDVGDVITVTAAEAEFDLPVGTSYTDVDSGEMICRFDTEDNEVAIAVNMGSFATEAGIGEKQTIEENPGFKWDMRITELSLKLKEKAGYLDVYNARNLSRTDVRSDYAALSDEAFANFRAVAVSGMKENTLYRSSTPIEPAIGRNEYAMAAMEKAGVKTVINLDDSVDVMTGYETYPGSYYSRCKIINPEMSYDFGTEEFAEKVKESVLFIIENDGPYLIHCKEGKDRTGILCAILESFVGVSAKDVMTDYMITYDNFYNVKPGDTAYDIILRDNLVKTLCTLYQADDIETADLREKATEYLLSAGLTDEQLRLLSAKLT